MGWSNGRPGTGNKATQFVRQRGSGLWGEGASTVQAGPVGRPAHNPAVCYVCRGWPAGPVRLHAAPAGPARHAPRSPRSPRHAARPSRQAGLVLCERGPAGRPRWLTRPECAIFSATDPAGVGPSWPPAATGSTSSREARTGGRGGAAAGLGPRLAKLPWRAELAGGTPSYGLRRTASHCAGIASARLAGRAHGAHGRPSALRSATQRDARGTRHRVSRWTASTGLGPGPSSGEHLGTPRRTLENTQPDMREHPEGQHRGEASEAPRPRETLRSPAPSPPSRHSPVQDLVPGGSKRHRCTPLHPLPRAEAAKAWQTT